MALCLIIDDDLISCEISERAIGAMDIDIVTKTDSVEALLYCIDNMPDIILLDMKMPKIDGFTFMKILRNLRGSRKTKVIACTGLCDAESVKKLRDEGVAGYLVKPYNEDALFEKVEKVLKSGFF